MRKGFVYILQCNNGHYYIGSTIDLDKRILDHQSGNGSNYTKKNLPVILVYYEIYENISDAFFREKQLQKWNHQKKKALIENNPGRLKLLSECMNSSHFSFASVSTPLNERLNDRLR